MRCEICQHENHIVGCPYYEGKHLSHCDVCGEFIYEGEEYLENNGGDLVHLECIQGIKWLIDWLGYEIKKFGMDGDGEY